MKIKQIEISGFKSFADKVVLDFQQPVTGVVGPNGCGKSNIVDAIRWCMGEQSARNLRGRAMEDVIFSGSESRRPLGLAEVSLVFSTEDGRAPARYLEYAEVQLTRRLYRDGESEYLINKTPCRLLDITELFMDTGVGTRAYSIIEQGKIGQILYSRPEERRFLIEEAAGVTKFKSRKQLALKKIEGTRRNLSRLADLLGEIRRQLATLQRQAKKAELFRSHREELRTIDLLVRAADYREVQEQRSAAEQELEELNGRMREVFAGASLRETELEQARLARAEAESRLTVVQEDIFRLGTEAAAAEGAAGFSRKELFALEGRLERLRGETADSDRQLAECREQQGLFLLRRDTAASEAAAMRAGLEQAEQELAGQIRTEEELGRALEAGRTELFALLAESARHRFTQENARKRLAALAGLFERHGREEALLRERKEAARRRGEGLDSRIVALQRERETLADELASLRQQEGELRQRLPELETAWQTRRDELSRSSSRLHSLQELEARFEGYGQGVRALMQHPGLKSGFSGVVADAVETSPEFEAAVEAALGDRLLCLVGRDGEQCRQALGFLRQSGGGRAGIALPVPQEPAPVPAVEGGLPLAGLVTVSGSLAPLLRQMLAGVMLVADLDTAMGLAPRYPGLAFVTREGETVSSGGIVTGGSPEQVRHGVIHTKREIRTLTGQVAGLEQMVAALGAELEAARGSLRELTGRVAELGQRLHQAELSLGEAAKDRQQATDECARLDERLGVQALEVATLAEEQDALEAELKQAGEQLEAGTAAAQRLEQETARLKEELEGCRGRVAGARERATAIRVQAAALQEQQEGTARALEELERRVQELGRRRDAGLKELEQGAADRERLQAAVAAGTGQLAALQQQRSEAEQALAAARSAWEAAGIALADAEQLARTAREESEQLRRQQADLNLRFSSLTIEAGHLERLLHDSGRVTPAEALSRLAETEFDRTAAVARASGLQRLLDEMGEVNLLAIEECAAMEERFTFLSSQKEDLEESLRGLQQAIQRINRTTRQRFLETYNQVNAKFQEVFPRLFCGGRAELRLTNEEDLLETGLDIIVQPPGKKLQNVTLLSGGEKALTAVALIFSIFLVKPTPFCLLDEVDAPLDDANIGRFNEMVREMSTVSQFIIITHNKTTMQVADLLYGITMEEPGASRVVSVRLQ